MPFVERELLLASQNRGKLEEMRGLVAGLGFRVLSPREIGIVDSPEETGRTFGENAALKAIHYGRLSGLLTVADDSGLSVDALGGAPGLFSSRFGGEGATDGERNRLLLARLEGVPEVHRGARFSCAVAVAERGTIVFETLCSVEGRIAEGPAGDRGFGYDPIFFVPLFGKTFGEVDRQAKDRVSHRGQAFARLRVFLEGLSSAGSTA
jgi:XTP/dITP diphosphohydrolase